jgi:hypothetical protein
MDVLRTDMVGTQHVKDMFDFRIVLPFSGRTEEPDVVAQ